MNILRNPASIVAATLAGLCLQAAAHSAEYTLMIFERASDLQKRSDPAAARDYWGGYNQFAASLMQAGVLRGGSALGDADPDRSNASTNATLLYNGARLGGYFVIDAGDLAAARAWAAKAPHMAAAVVVVPHVANPTMTSASAK